VHGRIVAAQAEQADAKPTGGARDVSLKFRGPGISQALRLSFKNPLKYTLDLIEN
jgi:hypothetical protein